MACYLNNVSGRARRVAGAKVHRKVNMPQDQTPRGPAIYHTLIQKSEPHPSIIFSPYKQTT